MSAEDFNKMSDSEKKKEDWMNSKWRPMMGWMYMLVCTSDFVIFPVLWSLVQVIGGGRVETQWSPITLQGAGLFHMAMGAILGIAAYGRTQEKLGGANNGGAAPAGGFGAPAPSPAPSGFGAPTQTTVTQTFGSPAPAASGFPKPVAADPAPVVSFSSTGKPMPAPQIDPPL